MKKKKVWVLLLLAAVVVLGWKVPFGSTNISPEQLKQKYKNEEGVMLPLYNLSQTQKIVIHFAADYDEMWQKYGTNITQCVSVHTDALCETESEIICYSWLEEAEEGCDIIVAPVSPVLATQYMEKLEQQCNVTNADAEEWEAYETYWGSAPMYYICIRLDVNAKKVTKLAEQEIIPFTVESSVEVPNVKGDVDENGQLSLNWDMVEGAQAYRVYHYTPSNSENQEMKQWGAKKGYQEGFFYLLSETKQRTFTVSNEEDGGKHTSERKMMQNMEVDGCYFVTALKDGKESNLSAAVETADLQLPFKIADEIWEQGSFDSVSALPDSINVMNTDGSTMERSVTYQKNEDSKYAVYYDYQVDGTLLGGSVYIREDDTGQMPDIIENKSGSKVVSVNSQLCKVPSMAVKCVLAQSEKEQGEEWYSNIKKKTKESLAKGEKESLRLTDICQYSNVDSAKEAWLAYHLLQGKEEIPLDAFPALQDPYVLEDTFQKVYLQNPYIMGVTSYDFDYEKRQLCVSYAYNRLELRYRQWRLKQAVNHLLDEIISEEMDLEEKKEAIYRWLVTHCTYDEKAQQQVDRYNYQKTHADKKIEDAANAYGILVKKTGLCQGFAYGYKVLCDAAGIKSKVVEGYLNGNIPHAWNIVEGEHGWYHVDVTNNENTVGIPYYLYQASTKQAMQLGYCMNKKYVLNEEQETQEIMMQDDAKEYYHQKQCVALEMSDLCEMVGKMLEEQQMTLDENIVVRYQGEYFDEAAFVQGIRTQFMLLGMEKELGNIQYEYKNGYVIVGKNN